MILDICITILVFLIGFHLKGIWRDFTKRDIGFLNILFSIHFFIAIVFNFYVEANGGDATHYWNEAKNLSISEILSIVERGSASGVMYLINYIPSNILELSFFTGNMLYAFVGYAGFIFLYRTILEIFKDRETLEGLRFFGILIFPWILLLPNLHFWSSGIGKDTLLFFAIMLFAYSLLKLKTRIIGILVSAVIAFFIRPHILLFLFLAFGLSTLWQGKLKNYQKFAMFALFLVGLFFIYPYVLRFIQLESIETSSVEEYALKKASALNKAGTGSGIDISGYPFPLKVFTFLYRPLFFDINGLFAILASFENLILLLLSIKVLFSNVWRGFLRAGSLIKGMLFFFIFGAVSFSLILGNLGIMLRQKNMFVPFFIVFGIWTLYSLQINKKPVT